MFVFVFNFMTNVIFGVEISSVDRARRSPIEIILWNFKYLFFFFRAKILLLHRDKYLFIAYIYIVSFSKPVAARSNAAMRKELSEIVGVFMYVCTGACNTRIKVCFLAWLHRLRSYAVNIRYYLVEGDSD